MLTASRAFLATVDDLRRRSTYTCTEYDRVQGAGLLRRLFIDKRPLMAAARSESGFQGQIHFDWHAIYVKTGRNQPMIFTFEADPSLLNARFLTAYKAEADGSPAEVGEPTRGGLRKFLQSPAVLPADGSQPVVSIHEVVKYYANRQGGVHFDPASPIENATLASALANSEDILGNAVSSISRIVVRALDPLAAHVFVQLAVKDELRRRESNPLE